MNAILLPTGGKVYVDGMDTADEERLLDIRRTVGMVFQNPDNQIVANVVEEDVAFAPENLGVPPEEIRRRVDDALKAVGMYEYREHAPHLLSGGQKQRVAIAGVIAMRAPVHRAGRAHRHAGPHRPGGGAAHHQAAQPGARGHGGAHHPPHGRGRPGRPAGGHGRGPGGGRRHPQGGLLSDVEELKAVGLTVPETTELLWELRQEGLDVPLDALSDEECASARRCCPTL